MNLASLLCEYFSQEQKINTSKKEIEMIKVNILHRMYDWNPQYQQVGHFEGLPQTWLKKLSKLLPTFSLIGIALVIMVVFSTSFPSKELSAKSILEKAEGNLSNTISYTIETNTHCEGLINQLSEIYGRELAEADFKIECPLHNTINTSQSNIWVDRKNKLFRKDDANVFSSSFGVYNESGDFEFLETSPTIIEKNEKQYLFRGIIQKDSEGTLIKNGVFISGQNQIASEANKSYYDLVNENIENSLRSIDSSVTVDQINEKNIEYYKINFFKKIKGENALIREEWYLKNTYFPYKTIEYSGVTKDDIVNEILYKDFSNQVDAKIFDLTPPQGYQLLNAISEYYVFADCIVDSSCLDDETVLYSINPFKFTSPNGQNIPFGQQLGGGGSEYIATNYSLKLYESNERFYTEQEAQASTDYTYYELKKKSSSTFDAIIKPGEEKSFSRFKLELFDTQGTLVSTVYNTQEFQFSGEKSPDFKTWKSFHTRDHRLSYQETESKAVINIYKNQPFSSADEGCDSVAAKNGFKYEQCYPEDRKTIKNQVWTFGTLEVGSLSALIDFDSTLYSLPSTKQCYENSYLIPSDQYYQCLEQALPNEKKEKYILQARELLEFLNGKV